MAQVLSVEYLISAKFRDENKNLLRPFDSRDVIEGEPSEMGASLVTIPGGTTDFSLPFGSVSKGHFLFMDFSRKATLKFDAADAGVTVGPGPVLLTSSDDGFSQALITTAAGEDLCVKYGVIGDNT